MSTEAAEPLLAPATGNPPQTPAGAARSLALYVTGEPELANSTLARYVETVREGFASGSYSEDDWNAALGLEPANPLGTFLLRVLEDRASDNDVVLEASKRLETVLKERHGAAGRGLHEYTSDVEDALPEPVVKTLRRLATVRNNVVHGDAAGDGSGSGLDGIHQKARYVLQAGRSYDWLVKAGNESENSGKSEVFTRNGDGKMSYKLKAVLVMIFGLALGATYMATGAILFVVIGFALVYGGIYYYQHGEYNEQMKKKVAAKTHNNDVQPVIINRRRSTP